MKSIKVVLRTKINFDAQKIYLLGNNQTRVSTANLFGVFIQLKAKRGEQGFCEELGGVIQKPNPDEWVETSVGEVKIN